MENKKDFQPDLAEAMRLAKSPAGKQLLELLRKNKTDQLQAAMQKASAGDYSEARDTINAFLSTPDAQALLEQLGGSDGSGR